MALSIGELIGTISLNDQFSGPTEKVADTLGLAGESFGAVAGLAGIMATAVAGATTAVVMLGQRGAVVNDVRGAFDQLTGAAGASADVMLSELRTATLGTISDFDLMSKANGVLSSGMVRTSEDMGVLAAGAKLLADRTGGDTAEAFDTLTGAMASGRVATLKQAGVFVDTKSAIQQYANALGVSVDKLTQEQRAEAIGAATLGALKAQLQQAGPATADFGDQIDRAKVMLSNLVDGVASAIAVNPVLGAGLAAVSDAFKGAFGGDQANLVTTIVGYVEDFAIGVTYAAQVGVTGAGIFVQAWYAVKTIVLGVITAVSGMATAIVTVVAGAAELAAKVPGSSLVLGDLAGKAKELGADMERVTLSLASETAEAARGAAGHSALGDKLVQVNGAIINVRESMEAAKGSTTGMAEAATNAAAPITDMGTAVGLTAAQIKAMEDQTNTSMGLMVESWTNAAALQGELQTQISLLQTSGIEARMLELQNSQQTEIASIQNLAFEYPAVYEGLVAAITEKYRIMGAAAQGFHDNVVNQARAAGFSTQADLQATADLAVNTYERMKESNQFNSEEMRKAWEKMEEAKRAATAATSVFTVNSTGQMLTAVAGALAAFGVRSKELAIAGAVLQGIAAIQKAWNSAPFPANIPAVTITTATTLGNIQRMRSSPPGYAEGTPDTRFLNFGRVTPVDLHGPEAVVTPAQGASLAGMVEEKLNTRDTKVVELTEEVRGLREDMAQDRRRRVVELRDAVLLRL